MTALTGNRLEEYMRLLTTRVSKATAAQHYLRRAAESTDTVARLYAGRAATLLVEVRELGERLRVLETTEGNRHEILG